MDNIMESRKLTDEYLLNNDYELISKDDYNRRIYRRNYIGYPFIIQVELNDYPQTNPNCGILSIYMPEEKDMPFPTNDDPNHKIDWPELNQPIAWHLYTIDRLHIIVDALTYELHEEK